MSRARRIAQVPAALLSAALVLSIVGLAWRPVMLVAGGLTWLAGLSLIPRLTRRYRTIVIILALLGAAGLAWGASRGVRPDWHIALAGNQPLISMLVAVSFVRLVAPREGAAAHAAPLGRPAVWQTMSTVHLLGSVINIIALDIVANRIFRAAPLSRPQILLLSRGYSTGAFWSPFWGASAAALTYAPAARLPILMGAGGCLAAVAMCFSGVQVSRAFGASVDKFRGYPLTRDALRLPVTLVVAVLGLHFGLPQIPVTGIIMISAPVLTVALMLRRHARRTPARLAWHALRNLPAMGGELAMFLSAGLLTAGFAALIDAAGLVLPVPRFGVWQAWLLVLIMVGLSAVGVHPVISIAVAASVLAPLHPDPTLFAMAGLIAWGSQAAGGPLSGLNVVLQARFGVDTFRIARWNFGYVLVILVLALPTLWLCALWSGAA